MGESIGICEYLDHFPKGVQCKQDRPASWGDLPQGFMPTSFFRGEVRSTAAGLMRMLMTAQGELTGVSLEKRGVVLVEARGQWIPVEKVDFEFPASAAACVRLLEDYAEDILDVAKPFVIHREEML